MRLNKVQGSHQKSGSSKSKVRRSSGDRRRTAAGPPGSERPEGDEPNGGDGVLIGALEEEIKAKN